MRHGWVLCVLWVIACGSPHRNNGDDGGVNSCSPEGAQQCQGASWQTCQNGMWVTAVDCPQACADMIGCVACQPGSAYCNNGDVWQCGPNGDPGTVIQQCMGQDTCVNGACVDACADAATSRSYIACEYWAVDLDNAIEVWGVLPALNCTQTYMGTIESLNVCFKTQGPFVTTAGLCDPPATMGGAAQCPTGFTCGMQNVCVSDAQHGPFAIVVSNPQTRDVHVTVTGANGTTMMQTIAAGQVAPILPNTMGGTIPDQSVDGTFQGKQAYKITSDLPIVAYQFNPLDNSQAVFSNDASLLIPRTAWDIDYLAMAWPTLDRRSQTQTTNDYYGYITIVAWEDNTVIAVTPTAATNASATNSTIAAGATTQFTLNAFDVLQLEASGPAGDLTGTTISSVNGNTFGVFGGHEAADFGETTSPSTSYPNGPCCADHLEEMLFPKSTWGKSFAIARSEARTNPDGTMLTLANTPDRLRIMAQKPNTAVTFDPAPSAIVSANDCSNLQPGQFCEVKIVEDTGITSTDPVLVGHYLESSIWINTARTASIGDGDPSMAIAVPTEQYRTDYTVLIPNAYQFNYLSLSVAPTGGVTIDGQVFTGLTSFASNLWRSARIPVMAGQHTIHCADGCGVLVYGYSNSVSYMFAGGLDLKQIVIQ